MRERRDIFISNTLYRARLCLEDVLQVAYHDLALVVMPYPNFNDRKCFWLTREVLDQKWSDEEEPVYATEEEARLHQSVGYFTQYGPRDGIFTGSMTRYIVVTPEVTGLAQMIHLNAMRREFEGGKTILQSQEEWRVEREAKHEHKRARLHIK